MTESVSIYRSLSAAWLGELGKTIDHGTPVEPRGMKTRERTWTQFEVLNPLTFPMEADGREFRHAIPVLEALSMIAQTSIPITFTDRVRKFGEFTDDGVFWGSYGARLHGQLGDLVSRLRADPDSRQGVLTIFDGGRDLAAAKRDIPCTIAVHFMIRNGELDMRVTMRSNDLWLGTPYDLTQFAILQATLAQVLGVTPGVYVHAAGSLHLYERDLAKAEGVRNSLLTNSAMSFPLWSANDLAGIVGRAQDILINPTNTPVRGTRFEEWADESLD